MDLYHIFKYLKGRCHGNQIICERQVQHGQNNCCLARSANLPEGLYILRMFFRYFFLARWANLPEGLYILPMFFLYFFILFFLMVNFLANVAETLIEQSSPKFQDW